MAPKIITTVPELPARADDCNKGDCGRILVVGGSQGMAGAPCMSARAAYRIGAGLVLVCVPKSIWDVCAIKLDECQTKGLGESASPYFIEGAGNDILKLAKWADIVVMGPGMTTQSEPIRTVRQVVAECEKPLVLDADALNAFDGGKAEAIFASQQQHSRRELVLTPHPGEMGRLLNISTDQVQADRKQALTACVELTSSVVVLKGARTMVGDGNRIFLNRTGNSGMATGGTGDVLAGMIGGLMGQGMPAFEAACLAVYLHGLAGDIAAAKKGVWSLIAGDLIENLPDACLQHVNK